MDRIAWIPQLYAPVAHAHTLHHPPRPHSVEERFAGIETAGEKMSVLQSFASLDEDPAKVVNDFFAEYKRATTAWLAAEDVSYFIAMCQRP